MLSSSLTAAPESPEAAVAFTRGNSIKQLNGKIIYSIVALFSVILSTYLY